MDDSEPTFSTEPSSSDTRARPFTCVFTRSCQSTTDFGEAVMVFAPRAMFAAGITRETSPARCRPLACGAAHRSIGMAIDKESIEASVKTHGDFVFMEESPGLDLLIAWISRMSYVLLLLESLSAVNPNREAACVVVTGYALCPRFAGRWDLEMRLIPRAP